MLYSWDWLLKSIKVHTCKFSFNETTASVWLIACKTLAKVSEYFPEVSARIHWCYTQLLVTMQHILVYSREIPPLVFFLVLLFILQDSMSFILVLYFYWPMVFLKCFVIVFSAFGNLAKCWSSGDSTFPKFPVVVCRMGIISDGVELLGWVIF